MDLWLIISVASLCGRWTFFLCRFALQSLDILFLGTPWSADSIWQPEIHPLCHKIITTTLYKLPYQFSWSVIRKSREFVWEVRKSRRRREELLELHAEFLSTRFSKTWWDAACARNCLCKYLYNSKNYTPWQFLWAACILELDATLDAAVTLLKKKGFLTAM